MEQPWGVTYVARWSFGWAGAFLLAGIFVPVFVFLLNPMYMHVPIGGSGATILVRMVAVGTAAIAFSLGAFFWYLGWGLLDLQPWSRTMAKVQTWLALAAELSITGIVLWDPEAYRRAAKRSLAALALAMLLGCLQAAWTLFYLNSARIKAAFGPADEEPNRGPLFTSPAR